MKNINVTDFHTHILPGADHGSKSPETTKAQLSILADAGVESVVATPHFYPQNDSVETFLEKRARAVERLKKLERQERPQIYLGAEVLVCPGIDHMPGLEKLCVEGTRVILLEMPFSRWREEHTEAVRRISRKDLVVVMAHIDRYRLEDAIKLCDECNVLFQINAETLRTFKGRKKVKEILKYLPVAAVGSDIHGADKRAVKEFVRLSEYLEKRGFDVGSSARALLKGAKIV